MPPNRVVVLGAGVSGLTTALVLARAADEGRSSLSITVVAKHMPGDYDIEYASPWAGANYLPVGAPGTRHQEYERETWPELEALAAHHPEAGVHFQDTRLYCRRKDTHTPVGEWTAELMKADAWFRQTVPHFRVLTESELPPGMDGGTAFTSVCINTALYLPWLASECLKRRIVIRRAVAAHVADAVRLHHTGMPAHVVVNCTGLNSLRLGGVCDAKLYPARGQIAVVRNEPNPGIMLTTSGTDDGPDEAMYVMNRAAGGGCILGGCLQKDNWDSQVDPNLAIRIMKRCVEACPELVPAGKGIEALDVIRHSVGLRPMRTGGIRVEKQSLDGIIVVHNYGHGGYGYQTSYGAAKAAVDLIMHDVATIARL